MAILFLTIYDNVPLYFHTISVHHSAHVLHGTRVILVKSLYNFPFLLRQMLI